MIFVTRKHITKTKYPSKFKGRSYINYNEFDFCTQLRNIEWEPLYQCPDVEQAWSIFKNNILAIIDIMCPIKEFQITQLKDPWISHEILENIRDKYVLLARAKRTDDIEDWRLARHRRNEVKIQVKNAKADFIKDNLNTFNADSKKFWKSMNDILPSKSKQVNAIITLKNQNNEIIEDDKIAANLMNNFFTSVGPNLAQNFSEPWVYHGIVSDVHIFYIETNSIEVLKLCKDINVNKSSAIDELSTKILKPAFVTLVDQLTFLFNLCLQNSHFPEAWKQTIVTPLPKEGDLSQCTNYRPISLLPLPGKILEHIIHNGLETHLEGNNLLNQEQGGFRKNNSTTSTVAKFTETIYNSINKREPSIATFIDFSKAFDTVNHTILDSKLSKLGIKGNLLKLIQNYLSNRKQRTLINNTSSDLENITTGVPQGSVLGPLLFLIHINDLCNVINSSKRFLYADDTVLTNSAPDVYTAHMQLQNDLDNVANWCKGNKLSINIKKTKSMLLGTRSMVKKYNRLPRLKINNKPLDYVFQYKYLGIILDNILSFNKHLNNTIRIVAHKISLLQKIRFYITDKAATCLYKTMVLPYLDYGDIFYIRASAKLLNKLQTLQDRALQICFKPQNNIPKEILHQSAQLATLEKRRDAHLLNFMYKNKNNIDYINNRNIRTRLHDAPVFLTTKPTCEKYKWNVFYNGAIQWNNLDIKTRNIETYDKFKSVQKRWSLL